MTMRTAFAVGGGLLGAQRALAATAPTTLYGDLFFKAEKTDPDIAATEMKKLILATLQAACAKKTPACNINANSAAATVEKFQPYHDDKKHGTPVRTFSVQYEVEIKPGNEAEAEHLEAIGADVDISSLVSDSNFLGNTPNKLVVKEGKIVNTPWKLDESASVAAHGQLAITAKVPAGTKMEAFEDRGTGTVGKAFFDGVNKILKDASTASALFTQLKIVVKSTNLPAGRQLAALPEASTFTVWFGFNKAKVDDRNKVLNAKGKLENNVQTNKINDAKWVTDSVSTVGTVEFTAAEWTGERVLGDLQTCKAADVNAAVVDGTVACPLKQGMAAGMDCTIACAAPKTDFVDKKTSLAKKATCVAQATGPPQWTIATVANGGVSVSPTKGVASNKWTDHDLKCAVPTTTTTTTTTTGKKSGSREWTIVGASSIAVLFALVV